MAEKWIYLVTLRLSQRGTKSRYRVASGTHTLGVTVQNVAALAQSVHNIGGGHGLLAGVLGVGSSVAHHVLHEALQHAADLLVDLAGDALHATTASQAADGAASDTADVLAEHLLLALLAALRIRRLLTLGHLEKVVRAGK